MKKKFLSLTLAIGLLATAAIGGTLAYFTDTDAAKNVMVTGKLDIVQNEHQRVITENADGTVTYGDALEEFEEGKKLVPMTGTDYDTDNDAVNKGLVWEKMFKNEQNHVDKIVSVTNAQDSEDAYVRTLFAFEMSKDANDNWFDPIDTHNGLWLYWLNGLDGKGFIFPENKNDGFDSSSIYSNGVDYTFVTIDGVTYSVAEYYYKTNSNATEEANGNYDSSIRAGQQTHASLCSIAMESWVDNDRAAQIVGEDGKYEILALTQATQKAGFDDAKTALDAAFGDLSTVNAETLQKWFSECK